MRQLWKRIECLLLVLGLVLTLAACSAEDTQTVIDSVDAVVDLLLEDDGSGAPQTPIQDSAGTPDQVAGAPEDTPEEPDTPEETAPDAVGNTDGKADGGAGDTADASGEPLSLDEDGSYTTRDDVALYLSLYGHLPDNFLTKKEARELGWSGGSLEPYASGCAIGGDRFGNREGLLPEAKGRIYYECDIDTVGADSRGAKRIVFSNDGLIYYTDDHYESFTLLYGEP